MTDPEETIPLIIGQLMADGYTVIAKDLAEASGVTVPMMPSSRLADLIEQGKLQEQSDSEDDTRDMGDTTAHESLQAMIPQRVEVPKYELLFRAQHQGPCGTAAFSVDGRRAATGSHDKAVKVLSVEMMKARSKAKPVLHTYYAHESTITSLCFHPNNKALASCSTDGYIRFYDLTKTGKSGSFRFCQDVDEINSISFHPSGNYMLSGSKATAARLWDVINIQCHTTRLGDDAHQGPITYVHCSTKGNLFATASADGSVRIWDYVSSDSIKHITKAHGGTPVTSVHILKDEKQVLTAGLDSTLRLWDISSGSIIQEYRGHTQIKEWLQAAVSHHEQFVMIGDETSPDVLVWDRYTGHIVNRIKEAAGEGIALCVASSPTDDGILTCSTDSVARYFNT